MIKRQQWMPILLCATAAVSGLAGGYAANLLMTAPDSQSSKTSKFARELLGHEQSFPPSEAWPGNTLHTTRDVLFEDTATPRQWTSQPSSPSSSDWSSTAEAQQGYEATRTAVETDSAASPPDVTVNDDGAWQETTTSPSAESSPGEFQPNDNDEAETAIDAPVTPSASTAVDADSGLESDVSADGLESPPVDGVPETKPDDTWRTPASSPQSLDKDSRPLF